MPQVITYYLKLRRFFKNRNIRKNVLRLGLAVSISLLVTTLIIRFVLPSPKQTLPTIHKQDISHYDESAFKKPTNITPPPVAITPKNIKLPIIMYHYVEYVKDPKDVNRQKLDIRPDTFERQLKSLKDHNYTTYFMSEVPDILSGKIPLASHSAVLTFDDGYEDFYLNALPLLKKYEMKGTIYIIYDFLGKQNFLTYREAKAVADSGWVEIASHTLDHLNLKKTPYIEAKKQIFESKLKLENAFDIKIFSFAYPLGAFNQDAVSLTKEAGYTNAVSVIPGDELTNDNLYYLPRIRAGVLTGGDAATILERYKPPTSTSSGLLQ